MIRDLLLKTFIPVSRILIMKMTFSYFPGILENPAPALKQVEAKYSLKKQKCYEISALYTNASKIL